MSWRVRIWCRDCAGDGDEQGCFGGGSEVLDEEFETEEQARDFGYAKTRGVPWEFQVFQKVPGLKDRRSNQ
jgi:hypothetical protein